MYFKDTCFGAPGSASHTSCTTHVYFIFFLGCCTRLDARVPHAGACFEPTLGIPRFMFHSVLCTTWGSTHHPILPRDGYIVRQSNDVRCSVGPWTGSVLPFCHWFLQPVGASDRPKIQQALSLRFLPGTCKFKNMHQVQAKLQQAHVSNLESVLCRHLHPLCVSSVLS